MKKIVHLIDNLIIGGAQTHLLSILKCADREKYSHVVYSLTDELDIGREIESLGIKVISLNLQEPLRKKRWAVAIKAISKMLKNEKSDILETHLTWSRLLGTIAFVLIGKKKIISFEQGDIYNSGWKYRIANLLASFFIDVIVVCSNAIKKWSCENYWFPHRKVIVMHNSILTDFFKPKADTNNFRQMLGIEQNEIVVGSVGTLGKGINKGMNYCIDAMSVLTQKYKNIKLVIVGDGESKGELERQVKNLRLEDTVKFLGVRRDIDLILNAMDIFVLASIFEPFGIALVEAMSMEKPVVGSASGGIPEIIEDGVNGFLFTPRDSNALAKIIDRLIEDEKLRKEIGIRARKSVEEKFEAKKYVKRLETIYARLLGEGG